MSNPQGELVDVTGAFASGDHLVIGWGGENYYKSCSEPVVENADGSGTSCVKREDHPGDIHEDFDGVRKTFDKARYVIVVSVPMLDDAKELHEEVSEVMAALKEELDGKYGRQVYNAVREQADQIIMILEGDG